MVVSPFSAFAVVAPTIGEGGRDFGVFGRRQLTPIGARRRGASLPGTEMFAAAAGVDLGLQAVDHAWITDSSSMGAVEQHFGGAGQS